LQQRLQFEWWIRVRTEAGLEGWVRDTNTFLKPSDH
jgi:hypothetical protein